MATIASPETLARLLAIAQRARADIRNLRNATAEAGANSSELIAHAYSFAGRTDAEANQRGERILRRTQNALEGFDLIEKALAAIVADARAAAEAAGEAEAKRHAEVRRLKI